MNRFNGLSQALAGQQMGRRSRIPPGWNANTQARSPSAPLGVVPGGRLNGFAPNASSYGSGAPPPPGWQGGGQSIGAAPQGGGMFAGGAPDMTGGGRFGLQGTNPADEARRQQAQQAQMQAIQLFGGGGPLGPPQPVDYGSSASQLGGIGASAPGMTPQIHPNPFGGGAPYETWGGSSMPTMRPPGGGMLGPPHPGGIGGWAPDMGGGTIGTMPEGAGWRDPGKLAPVTKPYETNPLEDYVPGKPPVRPLFGRR